jgi:hypothetical protein
LRDKIIPEFERLHGPEFQALIMVDNLQGHAAYLADELLVSKMNLNPGGAQARLHNGWFINAEGERIMQAMIFPTEHLSNPDQPKGMKQILMERGLCRAGLKKECKKPGCDPDATTCCATRILSLQPNFQEQKSLVQEMIEAASHLCIFLPKFYCELNFIEFFRGAVKKYLREHCDYTYTGLQKNLRMHLPQSI